jgi:diguanylate cyclase (GGDEF)-like protein
MSFRNRLTLFFVAIVIVPMISVAFVLFRLISDNENGKADARVAARQEAAINLYRSDQDKAGRIAERIGSDPAFSDALRRRDDAAARARARVLAAQLGAVRIRVARGSAVPVDVGRRDATAVAPARRLVDRGGRVLGDIAVSARTAPVFVRGVKRVAELDAVVRQGDRMLASTVRGIPDEPLPRLGTLEVGDEEYRVVTFSPRARFGDQQTRVSVLGERSATSSAVARSRLLAGLLLAGFFVLAFTFAVIVSRSLQRQIGSFLEAAQRLGRGDFGAQVPTQGRDEFAALGDEFNQMARELEHRLEELGKQRTRLENTLRGLGEAFASNLDRDALLQIAVRTTVDGVAADGGRARLRDAPDEQAGSGDEAGLAPDIERAEAQVLSTGEPSEIATEAGSVLAHPLRGANEGRPLGIVSVWRREQPFTDSERDLFHYLAAQAGVSFENVALHETVQRQAVTDELTGLFNHRRFQEALAGEIERSKRFGQGLGLVMLDIDNFKQVNDGYGHQVGDLVLAEVARVLRDESREVDEPARYGGEELAVVLPGADLEGAYHLAERVRAGIEQLSIPVDGGRRLHVTASFGAAAIPESAGDQRSLIAAADGALYAAKRSGKNRTVRAQ